MPDMIVVAGPNGAGKTGIAVPDMPTATCPARSFWRLKKVASSRLARRGRTLARTTIGAILVKHLLRNLKRRRHRWH